MKTFIHSVKGRITGDVVTDDGTWVQIRLTGNHELRYGSEINRGRVDADGEVLTVRKSRLVDVAPPVGAVELTTAVRARFRDWYGSDDDDAPSGDGDADWSLRDPGETLSHCIVREDLPHLLSLVKSLTDDTDEYFEEASTTFFEALVVLDQVLTRLGDLLTRTVNSLRGDPPPLTLWGYHDVPELAAEKVALVESLTAERDALAKELRMRELHHFETEAKLARVEALLDSWPNYQAGVSSGYRAGVAQARDAIRAALAEPTTQEADTD